jgi:hypothetical protein
VQGSLVDSGADKGAPNPFISKMLLKKSWKCDPRFNRSPSNTGDAMGIAAFVPSYEGEACR